MYYYVLLLTKKGYGMQFSSTESHSIFYNTFAIFSSIFKGLQIALNSNLSYITITNVTVKH